MPFGAVHAVNARDTPDHEGHRRRCVANQSRGIIQLTNYTGHPWVNVPSGFATQNNVQLPVSAAGCTRKALRVAKAYQDATGRYLRYPSAYVVP